MRRSLETELGNVTIWGCDEIFEIAMLWLYSMFCFTSIY